MTANSISVEVSRSSFVWIRAIWRLNMAVVKTNDWLMNRPAPFGERLQRPWERLAPNPKLKFMEAALLRRRVWFAFKPPADQQVSPTDQRFASSW